MGAVIDDRNFRGSYQDLVDVFNEIVKFDAVAGQSIEEGKTAVASTNAATNKTNGEMLF